MINTIIEFLETDTSGAIYNPGENIPAITQTIIGELSEKEMDRIFSKIEKFKAGKIRTIEFAGITGFPNLEQALKEDYNVGTAYLYNFEGETRCLEECKRSRLKKDKVIRIEIIDDLKSINTLVKKLKNKIKLTYEFEI